MARSTVYRAIQRAGGPPPTTPAGRPPELSQNPRDVRDDEAPARSSRKKAKGQHGVPDEAGSDELPLNGAGEARQRLPRGLLLRAATATDGDPAGAGAERPGLTSSPSW